MLATSCSKGDGVGDDARAIAFSCNIEQEGEETTRAALPLNADFVVWGYKTVGAAQQTVFGGYDVRYQASSAYTSLDNTHNYYYVGLTMPGSSPAVTQTIKYWDFSATSYSFWGYADKGTSQTSYNSGLHTLSISGLALATTEPTTPYYSEQCHRSPVSAGVVQLRFKRPYAKLRVMFYTSEPLAGADRIELTNISFGGGTESITSAGSLAVAYNPASDHETLTLTPTAHQDELTFTGAAVAPDPDAGKVVLDASHGISSSTAVTARTTEGGGEYYYLLPVTDAASAFTLSVDIDGDTKTAVVPASYMKWKPNFSYTYIFKITEAGKKIEIFDVKIDPWLYAGQQEETWTNW